MVSLVDEIQQLLAAPPTGDDAPELEQIEHTLTTGYARALALEAERQRLEGRLDRGESGDIAAVTERIAATAAELSRLRSLLVPLRERASQLRGESVAASAAD
jgi:hypothetical protein